ncbi:hypothetical protein [Roseomonas sp. 18066]|uniref:hypothetical protein n=1 Tax=Roseomonas sp. 18066 TaxID=2681412 RepID=UPI00135C74D1|nr:hypothetical protein [Roseomonas sp. 18066]
MRSTWTGKRYALALLLLWLVVIGGRYLLAHHEAMLEYRLICVENLGGAEVLPAFKALVCADGFTTRRILGTVLFWAFHSGMAVAMIGALIWFAVIRPRIYPPQPIPQPGQED